MEDWENFIAKAEEVLQKLRDVRTIYGGVYELHGPLLLGMVRFVRESHKVTRVHWTELDQAERMVAPYARKKHDRSR